MFKITISFLLKKNKKKILFKIKTKINFQKKNLLQDKTLMN